MRLKYLAPFMLFTLAYALQIYPNTTQVCVNKNTTTLEIYSHFYNATLSVNINNETLSCPRSKITDNYVVYTCNITFPGEGSYLLKTYDINASICVDLTPPNITLAPEGQYLQLGKRYCLANGERVNVIVTDEGCCNETKVKVYYNSTVIAEGSGNISFLPQKRGNYIVFAEDKAGNAQSETFFICLPETNPPEAKLINYRIVNNTTINATFYLKDDSAVMSFGDCLKNPIVEGYVNCTLPKQEQINLTATDYYGNSKTYSFTFDVTPPVIDILSPIPKDGMIYLNLTNNRIVLAVSSDTKQCWYEFNNQKFDLPINDGRVILTPTVSGVYTVYCEDQVGNVGKKQLNVVIDTIPPSVEVKDYGYAVDSKGLYAYIKFVTDPDAVVKIYKNGAYVGDYVNEFKDYDVFVGEKYVYTLVPVDYAGNEGQSTQVVIDIRSDLQCKLNVSKIPPTKYQFSKNTTLLINTEPKAFVIVQKGKDVLCSGNANEAGFYQCKFLADTGKNELLISATDPTGDKNQTTIIFYRGEAKIFVPIPGEFLGDILIVGDGSISKEKGETPYFGFYINPADIKVNVYANKTLVCSTYMQPRCEKRGEYYYIASSVEAVVRKYNANQVTLQFTYGDDSVNVTLNPTTSTASIGSYSIVLGGALLPFYQAKSENSLALFGIGSLIVLATAYYDLRGQKINFEKLVEKINALFKRKEKKGETTGSGSEKPRISLKERLKNFFENLRKTLKQGA